MNVTTGFSMKKSDIETALDHIDKLTRYFIDNFNFIRYSEEARAFSQSVRKQIMNSPEPSYNPNTQLPAGKYWIGDLCYVIQDSTKWDEVCTLISEDNGRTVDRKVYTLKDTARFMFCSTAYGDGVYYDQHHNRYGVDAGLIGMIEISDIDNHPDNHAGLGHIHTFDEPVTCGYFNGTLKFGNSAKLVIIETDADEDEENDRY